MESGGSAENRDSEAPSEESVHEEEKRPARESAGKGKAARSNLDSDEGLARLLKQAEKYTNHLTIG